MDKHLLGIEGEQLVASLLPGAEWVGVFGRRNKAHDVEWNGIKIEVKTAFDWSYNTSKGRRARFSSLETSDANVGVCIVLTRETHYFWVHKLPGARGASTGKIEEAITDDELVAPAILEAYRKGEHADRK